MSFAEFIYQVSEKVLFFPFLFLLLGSIYLSFKTRFIQIRAIPAMFKQLFGNFFSRKVKDPHAIQANKALFMAMATTMGVGSILSPIVAIGFGGPGALLGFLLAMIFGGASKFTEVSLAVKHRKRLEDGTIEGGPMQYIKDKIDPTLATIYAILTFMLVSVWQSTQSHTIASLLEPYHIPHAVTGIGVAVLILVCLTGGVKRIGTIAEKLVPMMFLLFSAAGLWIVFQNISKLPGVIQLIFQSAFSVKALTGAAVGAGFFKAMRWGLAKGFFSNEAGIGTAAIPHSNATTTDPIKQGTLAIISVYADGFLCLLSGLIVLLTGVWQDPGVSFNINMLVKALSIYFPASGPIILLFSIVLFAFTTILGNSYNGSQCFLYATKNRWIYFYYAVIASIIYAGAVADLTLVWTITDFFMAPVALINIMSIIVITRKVSKTHRKAGA